MPSRTSIAIQDGAATPLTHTFTPVGKPAGSEYEYFVNRTNGSASFQEEIRIRVQQPSKKDQPYRVTVVVLDPTVKVVDSVNELDFQNRADLSFTIAQNSTTQSREDLRVLIADLLGDNMLLGVLDNLESIY
jgi:hypothetical protein